MQDLQRAKAFCAEKLNLEPSEERSGGLLYRCGDGEFALFESASAAPGDHTQRFRDSEGNLLGIGQPMS